MHLWKGFSLKFFLVLSVNKQQVLNKNLEMLLAVLRSRSIFLVGFGASFDFFLQIFICLETWSYFVQHRLAIPSYCSSAIPQFVFLTLSCYIVQVLLSLQLKYGYLSCCSSVIPPVVALLFLLVQLWYSSCCSSGISPVVALVFLLSQLWYSSC